MRRHPALALVVALSVAACGSGGGDGAAPATAFGPRRPAPTTTVAPAGSTTTTAGPTPTTTAGPGPAAVGAGFLAFGDFGGGPAQSAVASAMEAWIAGGHRADALVTTGDNVYDEAKPELFDAQLDRPYRSLRQNRPIWATLGNHDVAAGFGGAELAHLGLPVLPYAKELPGVQFLFVNANHPDAAQAGWLDARLAEPGPAFRVVVFHQPAWSCGWHGSTEAVGKYWVPVLERHRVALILNGHDHDYQRYVSTAGVTYVVTGGGGRDLYPIKGRCLQELDQKATAVRHHFVAVEVGAHTLSLAAVGTDGSVFDRATVER